MKYIIIQTKDLSQPETPIIFPNHIAHIEMLNSMNAMYAYPQYKILSAGFLSFCEGKFVACYGESQSLKVRSREIDGVILSTLLS